MKELNILKEQVHNERNEQKKLYEQAIDFKRYAVADVIMGKIAALDRVMLMIEDLEK